MLDALRDKYEEMLRLRLGETPPSRERLADLARRFPGALREIDELPLAEIRRRIDALAHAMEDSARHEPWMHAVSRFHTLTRGALFAKRNAPADVSRWPEEARVWRDDLASIARPPQGRLTALVYERLGRELGLPAHAAKALVFPWRRVG